MRVLKPRFTVAGLLFVTAGLPAQLPLPLPTPPSDWRQEPNASDPAAAPLRLGRDALAAGRRDEALAHLLVAAARRPSSPVILAELARAAADDQDGRTLWGRAWIAVAADGRGAFRVPREFADLAAQDPAALKLAAARAAAVAELARVALDAKPATPGNGLVARWLRDVAWSLSRDVPALIELHAPTLQRAVDAHRPDVAQVLQALVATTERALGAANGEQTVAQLEIALRGARALAGLAAQAAFHDLEGPPPPDAAKLARSARELRGRIRAKVDAIAKVHTVDELEAMTTEERAQFTRDHATWASPGVAMSKTGRYRIETVCGHGTLLGVASTAESHHERLAAWYGKDPFDGRPGVIRIVTDASEMEAEDAPFWWAGGFQAGDLTVLQFAFDSIASLGRGLTHELTHRFDGVLMPFLPAWLTEGRAVWTGGAYGRIDDRKFEARHLNPFTVQTPFAKGYGDVHRLTKLIDGTIEDYRDNYTAGYALFAYLRMHHDGAAHPFAEPLDRYLRNARGGQKEPLAFFVRHFCDGKDGRPADFEAFVAQFRVFLEGCYKHCWGEAVPWLHERHVTTLRGEESPMVEDAPTYVWAQSRAEPWFGQDHARNAGRLLAETGNPKAAIAAWLWSIELDPWSAPDMRRLAELLQRDRRETAAWVLRHEDHRRTPHAAPPPSTSPSLAQLPATRAYLALLDATARADATAGRKHAAFDLACQRDDLRAWLGVDAGAVDAPTVTKAAPIDGVPRPLGWFGFVERGLTGYEERRHRDRWFVAGADLHVGREKPKDDTGSVDRAAHQVHAFTHTRERFLAGSYVVRTRVHMTTSFVAGCVVLGYERRDRNVRVHFSAGDMLYAIGRKDEAVTTDKLSLRVEGLHPREAHLPGSTRAAPVTFEQPLASFALELRVDGPTLEVHVEGVRRLVYTTPDGRPIEGHIGLAMGQGAVRLQEPTIERHERRRRALAELSPVADLTKPGRRLPSELRHEIVRGVPLGDDGTVVFFVANPLDDPLRAVTRAERLLEGIAPALADRMRYPQRFVLFVPNAEAEVRRQIDDVVALHGAGRVEVVVHDGPPEDHGQVFALFVDATGIARVATTFLAGASFGGETEVWARRTRAR